MEIFNSGLDLEYGLLLLKIATESRIVDISMFCLQGIKSGKYGVFVPNSVVDSRVIFHVHILSKSCRLTGDTNTWSQLIGCWTVVTPCIKFCYDTHHELVFHCYLESIRDLISQ